MNLISKIKRVGRYIRLHLVLNKASRIADRLAKETGKPHFVIKGSDGSLMVLTRKKYRRLVAKGKARRVSLEQMYQGCFYCTSWFDNPVPREVVERKRRIFFSVFLDNDINVKLP